MWKWNIVISPKYGIYTLIAQIFSCLEAPKQQGASAGLFRCNPWLTCRTQKKLPLHKTGPRSSFALLSYFAKKIDLGMPAADCCLYNPMPFHSSVRLCLLARLAPPFFQPFHTTKKPECQKQSVKDKGYEIKTSLITNTNRLTKFTLKEISRVNTFY